ncbi:MAG TPA: FxsA family protein [Longimicrobiales bacterium]|jgi:UPF0716 protein FxsA
MLGRLALLFVVIPLIELAILIQLGQVVGFLPTFSLVILTGVVGAILARAEGFRTFLAFQREVARGRLPGQPLQDALAVLVGGAFLLTPGILTDVAGFALLLPPSRRWIQRRVRGWVLRQVNAGQLNVHLWTPGRPGQDPSQKPMAELDPRNEIRPGEEDA